MRFDSADLAFTFVTIVGVVFALAVTGYVVELVEDWRAKRRRVSDARRIIATLRSTGSTASGNWR